MDHRFRNLALVSYDSVRADAAYSGRFPGVERLRRCGTTFRACISSSPLTPVSHATVMTGLQPYHHGIRHLFREQLSSGSTTLAEMLRRQGFATSAVVSCPGLSHWYGLDRGFDHYDDEIPKLPDGSDPLQTVDVKLRGQALKRAPLVVDRSLHMLREQRGDRFFHFIHFFDAHWPYEPPELVRGVEVANPYEGEIAYLDWQAGRWLDWLESSGQLEETLIVLFGDHGEDLAGWYRNDRGGDERDHPEEMGHGCLLYEQTMMVPLIFSHPSLEAREITEQVRLTDVLPTCMELLGLEPLPECDGTSLAASVLAGEPAGNRVGYSETFYPREQVEATGGQFEWTRNKKAIRIANQYKVIFHLDSDIVEVYDLRSDSNEEKNLV